MAETTFTFRVDDRLTSAFAEIAEAQDRTAAQLLRVLMREAVRRAQDAREHDAWFRAEVEHALREAADPTGRRIPQEDVRSDWRRQRTELMRRARGSSLHED